MRVTSVSNVKCRRETITVDPDVGLKLTPQLHYSLIETNKTYVAGGEIPHCEPQSRDVGHRNDIYTRPSIYFHKTI